MAGVTLPQKCSTSQERFRESLRAPETNPNFRRAARRVPRPDWTTWSRCSAIPPAAADKEFDDTVEQTSQNAAALVKTSKDVQPYVLPGVYQDCILHSMRMSLKGMGGVVLQKGLNSLKQAAEYKRLAHSANHLEAHIVKALEDRELLRKRSKRLRFKNHETVCRIHSQEEELKEKRIEFGYSSYFINEAIHELLAQEPWMLDKHAKFRSQRQISSLRGHLRVAKRCLDIQQKRGAQKLLKCGLQDAKLQCDLQCAKAKHADLLAKIEAEEAAIRAFLEKPQDESTPYGIFVEKQNVIEDLERLHLDIAGIHGLEPDRRKFFLQQLIVRYDHLKALTARLRDLVSMTRGFFQTLDMSDTLDWINGSVAELLQCATVRILLLDEHATFLWCITGTQGEEAEEEEIRFPTNSGLSGLALTRQEIIIRNSPEAGDPDFNPEIDRYSSLPTVTMMIGPIMSTKQPKKPIGIIQAFNKRSESQFDEKDQFLLSVVLQQASTPLENTAAFESERKKESINQSLLDIGLMLSSEHEFQTLSKLIITKAKKLLKADRCSIIFRNPDTQKLYSNMTDGSKTEFVVPEDSIAGNVARMGEGINVVDAYQNERFNPEFDEKSGYRTCRILCLPIFGSDKQVLGVIQMIKGWPKANPPSNLWMNDDLDPFTRDDEEALAAFCGQAAIALENARLYERMCDQPHFMQDLSRGVDLRTACKLACSRAKDICLCEGARLVMQSSSSEGLWSFDILTETVNRYPHSGVIGATFKMKKCVVLDHLDDPSVLSPKSRRGGIRGKYNPDIDGIGGIQALSSTICIPLMDTSTSKSVVAVLQLANKINKLPFNRQDEFMLKGFGNQVAVLLQSASLFDRVHLGQQLEDRLMSALEEMHRLEINSDPQKDGKFHKWVEESSIAVVPANNSVLFWLNQEGRPIHPKNLNPTLANAFQNMVASGIYQMEVCSGHKEAIIYAPVKGSRDVMGVLEITIKVEERNILGGWVFSNLEIGVLCQFAEHIGAFIESVGF